LLIWRLTSDMQQDADVKREHPKPQDIDALVAFLPRLLADGIAPIRDWGGGETDAIGAYVMPWPEYEEVVTEFFRAAGQDCRMDFDYVPEEAGRMLEDHALVRQASLGEVKTMLTYCVRDERFCDGHWGAMIERGNVPRLLERLAEIRAEQD
jgi:hypothetical protein